MTWIDEAIELEATPPAAREISVTDFAEKHGIDRSLYYWHMRKPENEKRVLELSLSQAKKGTSTVLDKLRQKAEEGKDMKAMEMYLKFVLALKERKDVTSNDQTVTIEIAGEVAQKHDPTHDTKGDSEGQP